MMYGLSPCWWHSATFVAIWGIQHCAFSLCVVDQRSNTWQIFQALGFKHHSASSVYYLQTLPLIIKCLWGIAAPKKSQLSNPFTYSHISLHVADGMAEREVSVVNIWSDLGFAPMYFFFFLKFTSGCAGFSLLGGFFPQLWWGLLSSCDACGFSCCGYGCRACALR